MKNVSFLLLLLMVFIPITAMTDSFADSSPPGVEISTDYELPSIDLLNVETGEVRIAVFDCDLKFWPVNQIAINTFKNDCHNLYRGKNYANQTILTDNDLDTSDQISMPVNKHGITDKEVCYTQNLYSYLFQ